MILLGEAFLRFRFGVELLEGQTPVATDASMLMDYSPLMRWHTNVNVYEMRRLDISTSGERQARLSESY